jgi:hypothetical protein
VRILQPSSKTWTNILGVQGTFPELPDLVAVGGGHEIGGEDEGGEDERGEDERGEEKVGGDDEIGEENRVGGGDVVQCPAEIKAAAEQLEKKRNGKYIMLGEGTRMKHLPQGPIRTKFSGVEIVASGMVLVSGFTFEIDGERYYIGGVFLNKNHTILLGVVSQRKGNPSTILMRASTQKMPILKKKV